VTRLRCWTPTAAKAEPLAAEFLEYLDAMDYNKYFDAMPARVVRVPGDLPCTLWGWPAGSCKAGGTCGCRDCKCVLWGGVRHWLCAQCRCREEQAAQLPSSKQHLRASASAAAALVRPAVGCRHTVRDKVLLHPPRGRTCCCSLDDAVVAAAAGAATADHWQPERRVCEVQRLGLKAAQSKLAAFLALMPSEALDAAKQQSASQEGEAMTDE